MNDIIDAWKRWVNQSPPHIKNRKMIVQIINAQRLSKRWELFDKAILNLKQMGVTPSEAINSLPEAEEIAVRFNYNVKLIRKHFKD